MLASVFADTEQKPDNPHTSDQTGATVSDERKHHSLGREETDNDPYVQKSWRHDHHSETHSERKEEGIVANRAGYEKPAPHHNEEADDGTKTTNKAELLRDNGEDEVGMRRW